MGTRTGVTTTSVTVTLTGSAVFSSATSYRCTAQNVTNTSSRVRLTQVSGTQFTLQAQTGTIDVNYVCIGN